MNWLLVIFILSTAVVHGKVYFKEEFTDDKWEEIWISSKHDSKQRGKFVLSPGKFYGNPHISQGIQTSEDARFYGISTKFEPFSNKDKVLVLQFSVKHEQNIDCGGGYIKVFDCSLNPKYLHGETPYLIMFGPDICGYEKKMVHVILNYAGKNVLIKKDIRCKDDVFTHLYTLIVKPDNTYTVKVDNEVLESGELEKDWEFLLPKEIKDLKVEKPKDWVDDAKIEDPDDKKPDDWEKPEYIPDKDAVKPSDWEDDMDGKWEPPQLENPEYKGAWKPRLLDNPNYKGPWIHPKIANPEYVPDPYLYKYDEICGVGFDLWQVKSGTIFDNILITDDELEASKHGKATWGAIKDAEKYMKENLDKKSTTDAAQSDQEESVGYGKSGLLDKKDVDKVITDKNILDNENNVSDEKDLDDEKDLTGEDILDGEEDLSDDDVLDDEKDLSDDDVLDDEKDLSDKDALNDEKDLSDDVLDDEEDLSDKDVIDDEKDLSDKYILDNENVLNVENELYEKNDSENVDKTDLRDEL